MPFNISIPVQTGGGTYVGIATMGASGPGGWVSINMDDVPALDGGTANSLDMVSASGTANMNYEFEIDNSEG